MLALAVVLALEGIGLVIAVIAVLVVSLGSREGPTSVSSTLALLVLTLVIGAGLVGMAVGAARSRPWVRVPAIVWQLVQVLVALYALSGSGAQPVFTAVVAVPAVVALVLLFTPSVRTALRRPDPTPPPPPPGRRR